jgi:hypothetical protein
MSRTSYRSTYDALKAAIDDARRAPGTEALGRAHEALDAFVATIACDVRKLRTIEADSPACAAEIRDHAERMGLPRRVLDPVHDASFTRLWLASLGDGQIAMLRRVLADEIQRRQPAMPVRGAWSASLAH